MTAAARMLTKLSAGAAPAGYQGMLTSSDILTTNPRYLKVKISSFQFLVFSQNRFITASGLGRKAKLKTEN
jgi:hypothetical protein